MAVVGAGRGSWVRWIGFVRRAGPRACLGIGLLWSSGGCCVPPPDTRQAVEYGFQTPEQAFESFRTAVQGELFEYEYRCFSSSWKKRNGVGSLLLYLEVRDQLMAENPFLKKGIYDAKVLSADRPAPDRALIEAESHGRRLVVRLVRQEFWEIRVEGELLADDEVRDLLGEEIVVLQEVSVDSGRYVLWGYVPIDDPGLAKVFSLVSFGREWKIDYFGVAQADPAP